MKVFWCSSVCSIQCAIWFVSCFSVRFRRGWWKTNAAQAAEFTTGTMRWCSHRWFLWKTFLRGAFCFLPLCCWCAGRLRHIYIRSDFRRRQMRAFRVHTVKKSFAITKSSCAIFGRRIKSGFIRWVIKKKSKFGQYGWPCCFLYAGRKEVKFINKRPTKIYAQSLAHRAFSGFLTSEIANDRPATDQQLTTS